MTQFQEMARNYLTPDNHKSKVYHLHRGRQLTGNANNGYHHPKTRGVLIQVEQKYQILAVTF
jgi:hypothetical protein